VDALGDLGRLADEGVAAAAARLPMAAGVVVWVVEVVGVVCGVVWCGVVLREWSWSDRAWVGGVGRWAGGDVWASIEWLLCSHTLLLVQSELGSRQISLVQQMTVYHNSQSHLAAQKAQPARQSALGRSTGRRQVTAAASSGLAEFCISRTTRAVQL
jgi:hypothetical protein